MVHRTIRLTACGLFEAGALFADGRGVPDAQSATATWLASGAAARVAWRVSKSVALELELDALAPLRRDQFEVGPPGGTPAGSIKVPALVPQASLGGSLGAVP
jgi:hypothetical protein